MKQIKVVFENEKDGVLKKFGYFLSKDDGTYTACEFNDAYEAVNIEERKAIGNSGQFAQKMARLIKYAVDEKAN